MDCERYLEALSARLDGEDVGIPVAALEEHLAGCPRCRAGAERTERVWRAARLHPAEPVPDLTDTILAAVAAAASAEGPAVTRAMASVARGSAPVVRSTRRRRLAARLAADGGGTPGVIRLSLLLVALTQLLAALPALFGDDLGATIHVAHEQGAWGLALAAGLALGAWQPTRASALLPLLGVFVGCLGLMAALDIASGRVAPTAEVPHLMVAIGVGLLWLASHPAARPGQWQRPPSLPGARRGAPA
jgi:predicted anti-sigma-YlaC factor YlaD